MDEHSLVMKIAEMRSYIASDWPDIEERKTLYAAIREMEAQLECAREKAKFGTEGSR